MDKQAAQAKLIEILQHAYSGELAAALAYGGHWKSLNDETERAEVKRIEEDELHHRARIGQMLTELNAAPDPRLEHKLRRIGATIAALCRVGGWFIPMYGAGRLESPNIKEYEDAARCAWIAGRVEWVDELLTWAEVEWDHERYFRVKCESHWLRHVFPMWKAPPARETIHVSFEAFKRETGQPQVLAADGRG